MDLQALRAMVCVTICSLFMCSNRNVAEFRKEIRMCIPTIVECLKDSESSVRSAIIDGLTSLAGHGMCYHLFPVYVLKPECSRISQGDPNVHSHHCGMSEGFRIVGSPGNHRWTHKPCGPWYVLPSVPCLCAQTGM